MNEENNRESNPARKRFKNEVTEMGLQDNAETKRKVIQNIQNQNPVSKKSEQGRNDNGNENEGSENEFTDKTQNQNGNGAKKEAGESEKVETRGRHVLNCDCEKCKTKREQKGNGNESGKENIKNKGAEGLDSATSAYKKVGAPAQPNNQQNGNKTDYVDLSQYISGALFLIAIDSIFPKLLIFLISLFDKKYKYADKKQLKLTPEEKKELEPLAEAVVKLLFGMVHPVIAFAITLGLMYVGKILSLDETDFKVPIKKTELEREGHVRREIDKRVKKGERKK